MTGQAHGLIRAAPSTDDERTALAALEALHARENELRHRLDAILAGHQDTKCDLGRLDSLCGTLSAQDIGNAMLVDAAAIASRIASRVRELDLEKRRVEETLQVVEQVAELKACVCGVVGSMGAPQDWEAAAGYLARASRIPDQVIRGSFAAAVVPTVEAPAPPWATLEAARESLCALFLREFNAAVEEGDGAKVTRFFKLFPLIDRADAGLGAYGRYVCQGVAETARTALKWTGEQGRQQKFFHAHLLSKLLEHMAQIIENHRGLVERHYGTGQLTKVIEKLQNEADIQGGIILDSWSEEKAVDKMITGIKNYPFSFVAQSKLSQRKGFAGSWRAYSPAHSEGVTPHTSSEDEALDLRGIDELLGEMAVMLGRWSLYCRFIAGKYTTSSAPFPEVLMRSNLKRKISDELSKPYVLIATFFFRRSVETAFQLDVTPSDLSLSKPVHCNPPFIIQAVDDIMYIVDNVVQKVICTSHREVVASVVPAIGRILETDFLGILWTRMHDETYPKPSVPGRFPEDKVVNFIVLVNSLDMSMEYLDRILQTRLGDPRKRQQESLSREAFPFDHDLVLASRALDVLNKTFCAKATELFNNGLQALLDEVVRPTMQAILSSSFEGVDYHPSEDRLAEDEETLQQVSDRFENGWNALMKPVSRIMTPRTCATLLSLTARSLATALEKRVWSYSGCVNALGAMRMQRDVSGIISTVSNGDYGVLELFARVKQILEVSNMDDEEWDECDIQWVLSEDEKRRARNLVRS